MTHEVDRPFRILGHLAAYALLGGLLLFALSGRSRPRAVQATLAWGIAVLYGVTDEVHQAFVPNRTGRIDDLVVDAIGAGLGVAVAYVVLVALARGQSRA